MDKENIFFSYKALIHSNTAVIHSYLPGVVFAGKRTRENRLRRLLSSSKTSSARGNAGVAASSLLSFSFTCKHFTSMTARVRRRHSARWYAAWVQYHGMFTFVWKPSRYDTRGSPRKNKKERKSLKKCIQMFQCLILPWGCLHFELGSVWWQAERIEQTFTRVAVFTLLWSRCYLLLFGFLVSRYPTDFLFFKVLI